jgi:hypothetical protein
VKEVDDIIEKSKVVQQKIETAIEAESLRQRDLLDTRLGQLNTRRRVNIDNVTVSYEPKNEMEVVILVAKIERRLREYVPDFELLTYASFQGVDCIASYRKSKHGPIERGFVEFETDLAHFFDHEHPFAHVSMIVCWSDNYNNKKVADIAEGIYGDRNAIYLEGGGLRRRLVLPDTSIDVLVLKDFPGIILEKV